MSAKEKCAGYSNPTKRTIRYRFSLSKCPLLGIIAFIAKVTKNRPIMSNKNQHHGNISRGKNKFGYAQKKRAVAPFCSRLKNKKFGKITEELR